MAENQVEEIKSKIDIVSIIGEHVRLTKAGTNFKGLCPFHQEKTPSFTVSSEMQIYKCFGCGEGGDVLTFLEKYEGMDFPEALRYLAEKAGVELKRSGSFEVSDKDILYELNALAAKFYNYLLVSHPVGKIALNYLKEERKITEESIKTFNIGFAPAKKNALSDFLIKKKKFKLKDLERAGLVFLSPKSVYDRFEGRIIFPISDHRGNVIALAGRQLPPGNPRSGKYINSPETPIYHKSNSLYGINITKNYIKKEGFAVVVEGELDLVTSFQTGVENIVAIKGSAFTEDQARLLSRYTKELVLALDSDFAGVAASIRGIQILEKLGFEIRVAKLGRFKDPDEAAKADPDFYKKQIGSAVGIWDFIIDSVVAKYDKEKAGDKAKISKELTPLLAHIENKIVQEHYINKLAKLLEVSEEAVAEEIDKIPSGPNNNSEIQYTKYNIQNTNIIEIREEKLIGLLLKVKPEVLKNPKVQILIQTDFAKRIVEEFNKYSKTNKTFDLGGFTKVLPKELFNKFSEIILGIEGTGKEMKEEINDLYGILARDIARGGLSKIKDSSQSAALQKTWKDFDSKEFERIIG